MNVIEKRYRLLSIREDIDHVDSKIAVIEIDGVPKPDQDRLKSASWHLQRAADILKAVSLTGNSRDMRTILEVSIQEVRALQRSEFDNEHA